MAEPDFEADFWDQINRLEEANRQAAEVLNEAREVYGPVPSPPLPPDTTTPASPGGSWEGADRWVTYPLWVAWVTALHAVLGLASLGVIVFGTALLALLGWILDRAVGLPLPVVALSAVGVGVLSAIGTGALVYRSYLDHLNNKFPW